MVETHRGWLDGGLALGLAAGGALGLAATGDAAVGEGELQRVAVWVLVLFAASALAWRSRFPIAAGLVTCGALALTWLIGGDPDQGPVALFVALIVAFYTLGGAPGARASILAGIVGVAGFLGASLIRDELDGKGTIRAGAYLVFVVAWLVGREVRRRREELLELRKRAELLECERTARDLAVLAGERARLARELHDVVAHSVSVMVVQAQAGPRLRDDAPATMAAFQSIETAGREALTELRGLLGILRRADGQLAIGPQPGLDSVPSLVAQTNAAGLAVDVVIDGAQRPLPAGIELSAYRIVQEALTNVLRHADATSARVVLRYAPQAIAIEITDDGRGASPNGGTVGHGLVGMRERAALYGGSLDFGPGAGGGFSVRALLPIGGPT